LLTPLATSDARAEIEANIRKRGTANPFLGARGQIPDSKHRQRDRHVERADVLKPNI
jgi:hypothetical protein